MGAQEFIAGEDLAAVGGSTLTKFALIVYREGGSLLDQVVAMVRLLVAEVSRTVVVVRTTTIDSKIVVAVDVVSEGVKVIIIGRLALRYAVMLDIQQLRVTVVIRMVLRHI